MDWEDLRYFLAVARSGSTLGAAKALRVSQTTAARRVAALEASLGLALFERRSAGYALTSHGEALVPPATAMEQAAHATEAAAATLARDVAGTVRLSVSTILAYNVMAPILHGLHEAHPDVRIDLDASDRLVDLAAGEAEVALRVTHEPEGGGVVGRRLGTDDWAVYCSRSYEAEHGRPTARAELAAHVFIGGGEPAVWRIYQAWLEHNALVERVAIQHSTSLGLLAAVRAGSGIAVLPCIVADHEPDLIRCLPPHRGEQRGIWLLTHERYRHVPRVRVVLDFVAAALVKRLRQA